MSERNYTVKTINGYRRQNLTLDEAKAHMKTLREQMNNAGWRGRIDLIYQPTGHMVDSEGSNA